MSLSFSAAASTPSVMHARIIAMTNRFSRIPFVFLSTKLSKWDSRLRKKWERARLQTVAVAVARTAIDNQMQDEKEARQGTRKIVFIFSNVSISTNID